MTRRVSFAGAYGIRSQGDDAALIAMVEGLRKRIGDVDGVVITRHAGENLYSAYGLRSVQNIEYNRKSESIGKWFRGFNSGDDRSHLKLLQEEMDASDLLVLGAGNFLFDATIDLLRGPIPYLMILTLMAKMGRTPIIWFGMSIGPFRTEYGRRLSQLAANLADLITVRDDQSCIELRRLGYDGLIVQLPDPVLGLRPPSGEIAQDITSWREAHEKSEMVIAVSVRNISADSSIKAQQYMASMGAICDCLASRYNATLLLIPHCIYQHGNANEDDRSIARLVVEHMHYPHNATVVTEDLTVEQCLSLYSQAEFGLCTRLHASVYSAIQGAPPVAINYHPKVEGFMHWLGCSELLVSSADLCPEKVLEKAEYVLAKRRELSEAILARVAEGRAKVDKYAGIACELIEEKGEKA